MLLISTCRNFHTVDCETSRDKKSNTPSVLLLYRFNIHILTQAHKGIPRLSELKYLQRTEKRFKTEKNMLAP